MDKKINISALTLKNLKSGKLVGNFPELYELEDIIENNSSHKNQSVFDHSLSVLKNLNKVYKNKAVIKSLKKLHLQSKKSLISTAVIFHDIGKNGNVRVEEGEKIFFPGHENESAKIAKKILNRIDLNSKDRNYIIELIKDHGIMFHFPKTADAQTEFKRLKQDYKNLFELILLFRADIMGGDLKQIDPIEYKLRMKICNQTLNNF